MGNCISKNQMKDGEETLPTTITTKTQDAANEAAPPVAPSSVPHVNKQIPAYPVALDGSSVEACISQSIQEQGKASIPHEFGESY